LVEADAVAHWEDTRQQYITVSTVDFVDIACHQLDRILSVFNAQGASVYGVCPLQYLLSIFDAHGVPWRGQ